jgi:hypothetical protein
MKEERGIFIFTRDRPAELRGSLYHWRSLPYPVYLVDDSTITENQVHNRQLAQSAQCIYLGKPEFHLFLMDWKIEPANVGFLLREPGDKAWSLGHARNFALLFARARRFVKVLFLDDDIAGASPFLVEELFGGLESHKFTGAHICGLPDDSILGHIATDLGIFNERTLSGGCLAFKPKTVDHFFLNNYNEDWIWLYLQNSPTTALQTGEVSQAWADPLVNYQTKVLFQEFGELLYEGVLCCYDQEPAKTLCDPEFWNRIACERKEYIEQLYEAASEQGRTDFRMVLAYLREVVDFGATDCVALFSEYFHNHAVFKPLFESLDR